MKLETPEAALATDAVLNRIESVKRDAVASVVALRDALKSRVDSLGTVRSDLSRALERFEEERHLFDLQREELERRASQPLDPQTFERHYVRQFKQTHFAA